MGNSGGSSSKSVQNQVQRTVETALSKEQLAILQQRQADYNSTFLPALKQGLAENTQGTPEYERRMATLTGNNAKQVNAAFDTAMGETQQQLARNGLTGYQNGAVGASLKAANERARASALANAYSQVQTEMGENKQKYLSMGLGMSPTATNAAPMGAESVAGSSSFMNQKNKSTTSSLSEIATKGLFS